MQIADLDGIIGVFNLQSAILDLQFFDTRLEVTYAFPMRSWPAIVEEDPVSRSPNEERRASVRHRSGLRVSCRLVDDPAAETWMARVRDLSALGIGLLMARRCELAELLEIELVKASGALVRTVLARVIHVEEDRPRSWVAGCAFVSELTDAEIRLFHAEAVRPKAKDHRRWIRFPCNVETVCYTCETSPGERRPARVLNISPGGIGLLLPCQFTKGTLLHFELPADASEISQTLLVRVVRVMEQSPGMWFLGCEFAHQLEDDELRALLR